MVGLQHIVYISLLVLLTNATQVEGNTAGDDDNQCPSWNIPVHNADGNTSCKVGSGVHGLVSYDPITKNVFVLNCYCVTYNGNKDELVIGSCPYTCFYSTTVSGIRNIGSYLLPNHKSNLSEVVCGQWNREGQMCGDCKDGFAPPILNYDFGCMECNSNGSVKGWVKFVAVGILPPTILFCLVIILRINTNSPKLIGFILFAQLVASAPVIYYGKHAVHYYSGRHYRWFGTLMDILWAFYGLFNLDFFYTVLPPFCIPGISTPAKLGLKLFSAVYPLLLTTFIYVLVESHARDVKIVVYLWKPFHKYFVRCLREGNIQTTIIDAFATVFLLSYVKILIACTDLIGTTNLYNVNGEFVCSAFPYLSATECLYQRNPWSVAGTILSLFAILILMIFPVLLMFLYPMRCFRKCLGKLCCCRGRTYLMFQTFMDCFLGYYKDGTNGTRDHRYVAGFYFLLRSLLCSLVAFGAQRIFIIPIMSGIIMIIAVIIAIIRPYKEQYEKNNTTDPLFLLLGGLFGISFVGVIMGASDHNDWIVEASALISALSFTTILILPLIYIAIITFKHLYHTALVQRAIDKMCNWQKCKDWRRRQCINGDEDERQIDQILAARNYGSMEDS